MRCCVVIDVITTEFVVTTLFCNYLLLICSYRTFRLVYYYKNRLQIAITNIVRANVRRFPRAQVLCT